MFFFIGGIQPRTVRVDNQPRSCPYCGHVAVHLKRVDHYIAIFFIPLIRIKKGIPFLACDHCNVVHYRDGTGSE